MNITKRKPTTPGEILNEEFMVPYGLTQGQLAEKIGVERRRINEIVGGKRQVTPDTATRLARLFGTTVQFWLNLQLKVDLWKIHNDEEKRQEYEAIERIAELAE